MEKQPLYTPPVTPVDPKSSKKWWIVAIVVVAAFLMLCSCMVAGRFALSMIGDDENGSGFGFGYQDGAVAVIHIDEAIEGTGSGITPESFLNYFDEASEDDSVKAIVLRIDSPGGTVAASEEIARYVKASKKPVVVSVGDMCASGAYMVASQADEIVALSGSSVGSIGVIMEIPDISELLNKIGVRQQILKAGESKDEGSIYRPLTEDEIKGLQGDLDQIHTQFIQRVADGRSMTPEKIKELADGKTFLGDEAKTLGLIDSIGTLEDACDAAAKRAHLDLDDYETRVLDDYYDPFGSFLSNFMGIRANDMIEALTRGAGVENSSVPQAK